MSDPSTNNTGDGTVLCQLEEIKDGAAVGVSIEVDTASLNIILIRQGHRVFAYQNSCPHTGVNLEWLPDEFMDDTSQYLVCATHGALFQIEDGECVAGPCHGESLKKLPVTVNNEGIVLHV